MALTAEQLEQEARSLPEPERRRLIERLQTTLASPKKRAALKGSTRGSTVTDSDFAEAKKIWR